jgi:hypothetical protein
MSIIIIKQIYKQIIAIYKKQKTKNKNARREKDVGVNISGVICETITASRSTNSL